MDIIVNQRHAVEVADILKVSQQGLETKYNLCSTQQNALDALIRCRTRHNVGHMNLSSTYSYADACRRII